MAATLSLSLHILNTIDESLADSLSERTRRVGEGGGASRSLVYWFYCFFLFFLHVLCFFRWFLLVLFVFPKVFFMFP